MEKKDYEDFVLRILRKDRADYVAIPTGPAEAATGPGEPFASPFGEDEIEELRVLRGCGSRELDPPKKAVRSTRLELGQRLFEKVDLRMRGRLTAVTRLGTSGKYAHCAALFVVHLIKVEVAFGWGGWLLELLSRKGCDSSLSRFVLGYAMLVL